ncbi:GNAT family N-acetyltransferase [Paramaledivibacter caminithermalis]|uniref:GNAT family N-acetyltransferase n=1 Tax=Paramaledivibacter caminithermalis TaxID=191027 RepID=UPI001A978A4F|nr:GNAT family N-acetyltransferase [Paramaledivibacter caminithermalis]
MEIKRINDVLRKDVVKFIKENWGSGIMVVKGRVYNMELLSGYIVIEDNKIIGLVTYNMENKECEIVSLDSLYENKGLGTKLVEEVIKIAKKEGCNRVWLITTNDNIRAIRFYQKRGFNMKALYTNSVNEARKIKPEIPMIGYDDIPILHEIEFEKII